MAKASTDGRRIVAENRRARHDFHILESLEAGLSLQGTEVKSLRTGAGSIAEAFIVIRDGSAFIVNMNVPTYDHGNIHNHSPTRERRLLLHRRELAELEAHVNRKGNTIVPLSLYFTRGRAKLAIGVAKGKAKGDRRQSIAERDVRREIDRELKMRQR